MSTWLYFFLPHSNVFVLKLRESLIKSRTEITVKKIVKNRYWGAEKLPNWGDWDVPCQVDEPTKNLIIHHFTNLYIPTSLFQAPR